MPIIKSVVMVVKTVLISVGEGLGVHWILDCRIQTVAIHIMMIDLGQVQDGINRISDVELRLVSIPACGIYSIVAPILFQFVIHVPYVYMRMTLYPFMVHQQESGGFNNSCVGMICFSKLWHSHWYNQISNFSIMAWCLCSSSKLYA